MCDWDFQMAKDYTKRLMINLCPVVGKLLWRIIFSAIDLLKFIYECHWCESDCRYYCW